MKTKLAVLMALALVACEKQETPPVAESPVTTPAPAAAAAPAAPVAAAAPTPSDIAPEGIFFLTKKVSLETSDGIRGFNPGEPVKQIKDGIYTTQDGTQLTLQPTQLTKSISMGRALSANDARAQAAIAQQRARTPVPTATPYVAQQPPQPAQPQPTPGSAGFQHPTATSMGADSVHNKTRTYYDYGQRKWVTIHVD